MGSGPTEAPTPCGLHRQTLHTPADRGVWVLGKTSSLRHVPQLLSVASLRSGPAALPALPTSPRAPSPGWKQAGLEKRSQDLSAAESHLEGEESC